MLVRLSAILGLALLAALAPLDALAAQAVGVHRLVLSDPLDDSASLSAVAFYPARGEPKSSDLGFYHVAAGEDAPMAAGRFPLVLLSHGNGGSPLAHHDLATALARRGFVVLAVLHTGDNYKDQSRTGTLSNLYGRPLQLSAAIDAAESDALLAGGLDTERVGVIGYSAGSETALILAGAQPDPDRLRAYCQQQPADHDTCGTQGELVPDRDDLDPFADERVSAVMLMAPPGVLFGRKGLEPVQVPVLLYSGEEDRVVPLEQNARALLRKLPNPPDFRLVPGAGHFVFMAPCSEEMDAMVPQVCEDADGVDRVEVHRELDAEAVRFFTRTLADLQTSLR
ncbi:prolyl oligopeptidase family serine peptidase [Pseudomonas otitidis]|uniref:Prolyl oligopeptidase family serine peptidase n=1 Tax=Metapseudomonas otitidis TaxID=319939 RepID=A0A7X3KTY9_9GAMM|nr:prolyl oligopeptidase family serine peptidase [Pseudomonas otitidis]